MRDKTSSKKFTQLQSITFITFAIKRKVFLLVCHFYQVFCLHLDVVYL